MINRSWPDETREMRLISRVIKQTTKAGPQKSPVPDKSLPGFIARHRRPGDAWLTWDELRYELAGVTGEIITEGTIKRWAANIYGIPENTKPEDAEDEAAMQAYDEALRKSGIEL